MSQTNTPVRKSRRLSGALPDLSLAEADKAIHSPAKARRSRRNSTDVNKVHNSVIGTFAVFQVFHVFVGKRG